MGVGKSMTRVDAWERVTGGAKYTADLMPQGLLVAKVVRSTIVNGVVKSFDLEEALKVPGVVKIVTCSDVPDIQFPTPGHPWSVETAHQDISDRKLLNIRVWVYGDDIAAIIAENDIAAAKAARLVHVEYEEYELLLTMEAAMAEEATQLYEEELGNVIAHSSFQAGETSYEGALKEKRLVTIHKDYKTQSVQHCRLEAPISYAYMESGRIVVVSFIQIPHIVRRVIGQALRVPWGDVRVVKPYIGGGFGNKQDVLYEPLNAFLCTQVGGRGVEMEIFRGETLACTRVRHTIELKVDAAVRVDGTLVARKFQAYSNQGGYASHAHVIVANTSNEFKQIYYEEKALEADAWTVYTSITTGGAIRGYDIPQATFAAECMAGDLAAAIHMDPLEFRLKNCMRSGYADPHTKVKCNAYGLQECIQKGREYIHWDEKRKEYENQTGPVCKGVGTAIFRYKTGVYPISLETTSCRMMLNQDGSIQLQIDATETGQGTDTVSVQMATEVTGITKDRVHIIFIQDTDITPFDTGAYASRQTYINDKVVKMTGEILKEKILDYASYMLDRAADTMDIENNQMVDKTGQEVLLSMEELATTAFYSPDKSVYITAEATSHCKDNTFTTGTCFAKVEMDIPLGQIKVTKIANVHDSGILINPKLAETQIYDGMSMGPGYGLSKQLLFDKPGRPFNNNLLDYKLPTAMDTSDLHVEFVKLKDPTGPFGNKALREPPAIPVAPAIRNTMFHATGVAVDSLPLDPQKMVEHFKAAGLI